MRSWDGELFYDKEMRIEYAKTRSHATRKVEEPGWDPLTEAKAKALGLGSRLGANGGNKGRITTSSNAEAMEVERENDQPGAKRDREDETTSPITGRTAKRGRGEDGEEMDMDDDQEATPSNAAAQGAPPGALAFDMRMLDSNVPYPFLCSRNIFPARLHDLAPRNDPRGTAGVIPAVSVHVYSRERN
jgi:hypothetical protein